MKDDKIYPVEWEGKHDNNDGYIYGIEWEIGDGDVEVMWFTTEELRNKELKEMKEGDELNG